MSFSDDIDNDFKEILNKRDRLVKSASVNLYVDLVKASPIDSGELSKSWQLPKKLDRFNWIISNTAPHAVVIDGGRREVVVNGAMKEIGSKQLEDGFDPIVKITEKKLQKELNKI